MFFIYFIVGSTLITLYFFQQSVKNSEDPIYKPEVVTKYFYVSAFFFGAIGVLLGVMIFNFLRDNKKLIIFSAFMTIIQITVAIFAILGVF